MEHGNGGNALPPLLLRTPDAFYGFQRVPLGLETRGVPVSTRFSYVSA
jgi:hypothetical protein